MSNLWFNVRFGEWHVQIGPDRPFVRLSHNAAHTPSERDFDWRWFEVYEAPWK